jgi:8-oxo-dGTP pyrophosphatase MutT (NUDIX family)
VDALDDAGRPVGVVTRREMRARRLPHRSTYILVLDMRGDLFVHLRTATKDVYPSHWDPCAGGVLAAGEDFATGAARELREELGVVAPLEELFPFRWADAHNVVHGMVFRALHGGPFRLQPEEIVRGEFLPLDMVEERARWEPFCPDGLAVVQEYRRRVSERRR